jgi:hypothetical protein
MLPDRVPAGLVLLRRRAKPGGRRRGAGQVHAAVKSVYATKSVPDVGLDGVRAILDLTASPAARNAGPSRWIDNSIIDAIARG